MVAYCSTPWLGPASASDHDILPQENATEAFSHSPAEANECALPPTLFTYLAKVSECAQSTQGMPLGCLALEAKKVCVPGQHRAVIEKTALGRLPPPDYHNQQTETHPQPSCN